MPETLGKGNTTPELHALICSKYQDGISSSDIAAFSNTTTRTVQRIIKNYQERGHHDDAARSGRPPRLDDRGIRHLKYTVEGNRRQTLSDITTVINGALSPPAHPRTIKRALHKHLDMHSRIAAKKPFFKDSHKQERLKWARTHKGVGYGVVEESHLDRRGLSGDRETVKAGYGVEEAWGEIFPELSLSNIQVRKAELDGVGVRHMHG